MAPVKGYQAFGPDSKDVSHTSRHKRPATEDVLPTSRHERYWTGDVSPMFGANPLSEVLKYSRCCIIFNFFLPASVQNFQFKLGTLLF